MITCQSPSAAGSLSPEIKAVLRRAQMEPVTAERRSASRYRFDRWMLDIESRELSRDDGVVVPLSSGEYDLLVVFVKRPERVLSRDQLLDLARGRAAGVFDRSIDTQISRLRKKIEQDPGDPKIIKTVWGGGYVFASAVKQE